jgi:glycosyltransferase involved in cell wall biosynthesis
MKIAHIGPERARRGGPAGYAWQLSRAAAACASHAHSVTFPLEEVVRPPSPVPATTRVRRRLSRIKRSIAGPPVMFRPSAADLRRDGGVVEALVRDAVASTQAAASPSLDAALAADADVLFAHDAPTAQAALQRRRPNQHVWLMLHSPMPLGLYLGWNWAVPEWPWEAIAALPDVRRWAEWEAGVCCRVDRIVAPCAEAIAELVRADAVFASLPSADYVPTGASAPSRSHDAETPALRARWNLPIDTPIGLFIGTLQSYRGFDALVDALTLLPSSQRGIVAVAGPSPDAVPSHPRLRALGSVRDVGDLLQAVDFVINVNRFSLFDLSMIEAAEAGRPLLLHTIGGNRWFRAHGVGCVPIADLHRDTIAAGVSSLFVMDAAERNRLGRASRACYEQFLTPKRMWDAHWALYDRAALERPAVIAR